MKNLAVFVWAVVPAILGLIALATLFRPQSSGKKIFLWAIVIVSFSITAMILWVLIMLQNSPGAFS